MTTDHIHAKPLPMIDHHNRTFWEGTQAHELRLLVCDDCNHIRYQTFSTCPHCGSNARHWIRATGKGTVWSWTRFHKTYFPGFARDMPYVVVVIELDEGPKLYANMVDMRVPPKIGTRVKAVFETVTAEVTLVKFEPA